MELNRRHTVLSCAVAVVAATALLAPGTARATVAFDGSTTYSQNFDTLPSSPTNASGVVWHDDYPGTTAPQDTASLPGWFIQAQSQQSASSGNWQRFRIDDGSHSTGSIYSYGTSAATERALGILGATTVDTQWMALRLQNTSGQTIDSLTITYDGEQWRAGTLASAQTLTFGYALDAGSIRSTSFAGNSALDFTALHTGTGGGLDGNDPANRTAGITSTLSNLGWEPGQDLWLRWTAPGPSGSHGMAVDNLTVGGATFVAGAGSPTWKADADGTWSAGDTSNWLNGNVPAGTGGLVRLGSQITADRTVTLATSPTVSTLEFNGGAHNYTLAASGGNQLNVAAGGSVVVNGVSYDSTNLPTAGNVLSAPVHFASDASFRVDDPLGKLTVSGPITVGPGGGLTLAGAGSVTLPSGFTWSGPTTIDGASLSVSTPSQLGDGSPTNTLVLLNGGTINAAADMAMTHGLNIGSGGGTVAFASTNNVTFAGPLTGTGTFTKLGPGTVSVAGANVTGIYIQGLTRNVGENGGTVQIAPDSPTSVINFLRLETNSDKTSGVYLGKLDLTNNALVYDYTDTSPFLGASKFADNGLTNSKVYTAVWYAANHGGWNNTVGITSSYINSDANDPSHVHAIAVAEASELGITGAATWNGQAVDSTAVLLLYTLAGDANMNGKIDADDYAIIDRSLAENAFPTTDGGSAGTAGSLAHWVNGDFNYDGAVDSADLLLVDKSLATQNGGVLSPAFLAERQAEYGDAYVSALLSSVPEPGSLSLLAVGAGSLLGRRRRRRGI